MKKRICLFSVMLCVFLFNYNAFAIFNDFIGADHWDDLGMTYSQSSSNDAANDGKQTVHGFLNSLWDNMYHTNSGSGWGMWLSASGGGGLENPSPTGFNGKAWIWYDFGQSYNIKDMMIWNYNQGLNRGLKTVVIKVSKDGISWTNVFSGNLNKGTGLDRMPPTNTIPINREFQFVEIDCTANFSLLESYYGLSEVRWNILNLKAVIPSPADGVADVNTNTSLTWTKGTYAGQTQGHDVYFGDNYYDVLGASVSETLGVYKGRQSSNTYNPGILQLAKTYYWRIDEVNQPNLWKGDVWSFTTDNNFLIDNFNTDLTLNWQRIGNGSMDAAVNPCNGTGAMKITYANNNSPYYSAAMRTYSPGNYVDLKSNGIKSLTLNYRGSQTNGASHAVLFLELTDSGNRTARVQNPDPNAVLSTVCTQWNIDLAGFTQSPNPANFDLANIMRITIGVGDGQQPASQTTGEVLIDDLVMYPVRCFDPPAGDMNNDCKSDYKDLRELARFWLDNNRFPQ